MNRAGYMAPIGELISESLRSVKTRVFPLSGKWVCEHLRYREMLLAVK